MRAVNCDGEIRVVRVTVEGVVSNDPIALSEKRRVPGEGDTPCCGGGGGETLRSTSGGCGRGLVGHSHAAA